MHEPFSGRDVLRELYAECDGVLELRALPSRSQHFFDPEDTAAIKAFVQQHATENVYWAVASRLDASSGTLANAKHLGALFCDLDFKDTPEPRARAAVAAFPFPATIVIASGGGLQCYWLLREPVDLQVPYESDVARDGLRRLAVHLGADLQAAEPARVLRVPRTKNIKYSPARLVSIQSFEPERRYNLSEVLDWLPVISTASVPAAALDLSKPVGQNRNVTLYKLGRGLKARQLPAPVLAETLHFVNGRCCAPPLQDWEVKQIVHNILSQPDRAFPAALDQPGRVAVRGTVVEVRR